MPNKFIALKRNLIPKQRYKLNIWSDCCDLSKQRRRLVFCLNDDLIHEIEIFRQVLVAPQKT